HIADTVAVMYLGKIVESAPVDRIFSAPQHPYTKALLASVPSIDPEARPRREILKGDLPSPIAPPPGCRFHPRCPVRADACSRAGPRLLPVPAGVSPPHETACHLVHPPG